MSRPIKYTLLLALLIKRDIKYLKKEKKLISTLSMVMIFIAIILFIDPQWLVIFALGVFLISKISGGN